ncbi:14171_t:CDS:2, partial [Acaulospora morrowiae]
MLRIPRIVPWTSPQEYQQVYEWLYSDSLNLRELGIKRVKAWSSRGKVPQAIVCTSAFVEVSLRDEFGKISNHELRLLYSMIFIRHVPTLPSHPIPSLRRFVNGLVDQIQGNYAESVASLALKLDLPLWFVELRHAGTHEHLPSLQVLRNGCQQALEWLNRDYWTTQKPFDSTQLNEIRSLISKYKEIWKKYLKAIFFSVSNPSEKASAYKVVEKLLNLISAEYIKDLLVPILLENGFLVPKGKRKRASVVNATLSDDLIDVWFPMLERFDSEWSIFGDELVQGMLEILVSDEEFAWSKSASSSFSLTIVAWISYFLRLSYNSESKAFKELDREGILEFCLRKPTTYTNKILQLMTDFDDELKES